MRPKPTNVACTVRPARRQQARTPNSATTSASQRTCSALSSSRSAWKESSECLPSTGPARAMITTWKNVSPTRKRCRARHTLSGRDPPEGTSDHMWFTRTAAVVRQARMVMGGKRAKAMPMLLKSKNRGVVALRGAPDPDGQPFLIDSVARPWPPVQTRFSRNGAYVCCISWGVPATVRVTSAGGRTLCATAPVLPEIPSGTVPSPDRLLPRRPVGPSPGAQRRPGERPQHAARDDGRHGAGGHRPGVSLSHVRAPDRRDPRGRLSDGALPRLQRLHRRL